MEENKFKCNDCEKYYKSYQSLWNHKKKFHTQNIPIISPNVENNIPILSPNIPTNDPQLPTNNISKKIKKTEQPQDIGLVTLVVMQNN